ncbi:MAG: rubrerythrin family protein [Rikenellaceae bacterium]
MKSIMGTETERNLLMAFAGESQARNRYLFFAAQARKEGYQKIADYFEQTANNEKEHAELYFKHLEGGMVEITASYPAGVIGDTAANLMEAAGGEHEEWTILYPMYAEVAQAEGFPIVAKLFRGIAEIEGEHYKRYMKIKEALDKKEIFHKKENKVWRCEKCGHEHIGHDAPDKCPICDHPQAYFDIKCDSI